MRYDPLNRQARPLFDRAQNPPRPGIRTSRSRPSFFSSLFVEVLRELVKGGPLFHCHETGNLELLARLLHGLRPAGDPLVCPLPIRRSLLADDLAALVLDEVALLPSRPRSYPCCL